MKHVLLASPPMRDLPNSDVNEPDNDFPKIPDEVPKHEEHKDDEDDDDEIPKRKKGFAAMDPERRKALAAKGGRISRGGGRTPKRKIEEQAAEWNESTPRRKRGFAAMDPEKRKAIAALGGSKSRGGGRPRKPRKKKTTDPNSSSRRGFAAMDPEKRRQVAASGGRASHKKTDKPGNTNNSALSASSPAADKTPLTDPRYPMPMKYVYPR